MRRSAKQRARRALPPRLDADGKLYVRCFNSAWSTRIRLISKVLTQRLNAVRSDLGVAGIVAAAAPIRIRVLGPARWPHYELLTGSLETAWHDVTQEYGPSDSPVFVHGLPRRARDRGGLRGAIRLTTEGHTTDRDTCGPDCPADDPGHRVQRKDWATFCRDAVRRLNHS